MTTDLQMQLERQTFATQSTQILPFLSHLSLYLIFRLPTQVRRKRLQKIWPFLQSFIQTVGGVQPLKPTATGEGMAQ